MKKLTLFYLENCPYCHNARRALEQLRAEDPACAQAEVEWIEESREPELAAQYDYYYVPSAFVDGCKLYEAHPSEPFEECKAHLREAIMAARAE